MSTVTNIRTVDVRFPTSIFLDGSDAMNPDPDYSAAYLVIETDAGDGLHGAGFVFTIGRGNDIQSNAIDVLASRFVGRNVEQLLADMGATWREMLDDSQLRWLGPGKGGHPHGDRCGDQRILGSPLQASRSAAVAAPGIAVSRRTGGCHATFVT